MAQYLDLEGLSKYNELIKALINKADADLGGRIDAVIEDCGENNSTLTEIISLIGNVEDGKTLAGLISDLNKEDENLRKLISEIAGVDSDAGENFASLSEIVDQIKNLQDIIGQKYSEGSDAETIVGRLDDLEKDGEKYKPAQSLVDATDLKSDVHGGLGSHNAAWFKKQGYTYSQMFDAILFPTVIPTITNPSLSWKNLKNTGFAKYPADVIAIIEEIKKENTSKQFFNKWAIIGADIGASTGIIAADKLGSVYPDVIVMISPVIETRGLYIPVSIAHLETTDFLAISGTDDTDSVAASDYLKKFAQNQFITYTSESKSTGI